MKKGLFSFFRFFDILRRIIINLVFWGIIAGAVILYIKSSYVPETKPGTVLVVNPSGTITEHTHTGAENLMEGIVADEAETPLRSILAVLEAAASDGNISSVFLDLGGLEGSGFSKLQEASLAVEKVREAGKTVIAFAENYTQGRYYLASFADRVIMDPRGTLMITGFGDYGSYFGRGLRKFGINVNVFRTGNYKSAVEPFTSEGMSQYSREASTRFLEEVWEMFLSDIASRRKISVKKLENHISGYAALLESHRGNSAEAAKESSLVDDLMLRDEALKLAGEGPSLDFRKYYSHLENSEKPSGNRVAVVIASGAIAPGKLPPGMIGSETYSRIFDKVRNDKNIKALVLRIDSGGGGVGASEEIRRSLEKVREEGKSVVVSMSSLAASGAYWIATASDEIICMPSTLTGSIGVFAMMPDFSAFLEKYPGITSDGVGTTLYSSFYNPGMPMTADMKKVMQLEVENDYDYFISLVSASRKIPESEAKKYAGGRIWSGGDAAERKLADRTGSLSDAIASAAEKAGLDDYTVVYIEPDEDWRVSIAREISKVSGENGGALKAIERMALGLLSLLPGKPGWNAAGSRILPEKTWEVQALYPGSGADL